MTIPVSELLQRLSDTLRGEIGPVIADDYVKTQAFMAAAILDRVARQVALAPGHREAERSDVAGLLRDLAPVLDGAPDPVAEALATAGELHTVAAFVDVIDSLYRWGVEQPAVTEALSLIRPVLRRDIDRRMEVAG